MTEQTARAAAVQAVKDHPSTTFMAPYESLADAVLAAAEPLIRAAVLRGAADALQARGKRLAGEFNDSDILHEDGPAATVATWKRAEELVRRMADEAQP